MDSALQLQKRIETLEARLAVNAQGGYRPTKFEYETEVPSVSDLRVVGTQVEGSWTGALTWVEPQNKDIAAYEIWARNVSSESSGWVKKGEVTQPPWSDTIVTDSNLTVQFSVRTKFRNGLGMTIENSPTVPVSILAPSVSITDPSQVGPNVIGDSAFIRSGGDAIAIGTADIVNASITNAKIVDLAAAKITAGTLAAGVIYANAIAASQITAGTISAAILMTSPTILASDGTWTAEISAGVCQVYVDASPGQYSALTAGGVEAVNSSGTVLMGAGGVSVYHNGGSGTAKIILQATSSGGIIAMANDITLDDTSGEITAVDYNATGEYQVDGVTVINSSGAFVGAGVDVGSNGVGCGGVNINGDTGETVTFNAFPTQMVFKGGVLTGYTP